MSIETIIKRLSKIVSEWQEAADGQDLEDVKSSVRLILDDVCRALGIEPTKIGL